MQKQPKYVYKQKTVKRENDVKQHGINQTADLQDGMRNRVP